VFCHHGCCVEYKLFTDVPQLQPQTTFAGNPVFFEGVTFDPADYGHALELGYNLNANREVGPQLLLAAIRRALDSPPDLGSKIALIGHGSIVHVLFTCQEDAEYALASQLGLNGGILSKVRITTLICPSSSRCVHGDRDRRSKVWVHHPDLPRAQAVVYTTIEVVAVPGSSGRAVHDEVHRLCGEIAFIRWRKVAVDDRTEAQRDHDEDEEAERGLARRFPRSYEIYFRQSSGQRCAQELHGRPNKPDVFKRGFKVYRIDHLRRPFLEKPVSLDPPDPGGAPAAAHRPSGPSTAGPSTAGPSTAGPSTAGPSTAGPSAHPPAALPRRGRHARRAPPPIPDSVSVADNTRLTLLGFLRCIRFTEKVYTAMK